MFKPAVMYLMDDTRLRITYFKPGGGEIGPELMLMTSKGSSPIDMNQISFLGNFSTPFRFPKFRVEISQILESSSQRIPRNHRKKRKFQFFHEQSKLPVAPETTLRDLKLADSEPLSNFEHFWSQV